MGAAARQVCACLDCLMRVHSKRFGSRCWISLVHFRQNHYLPISCPFLRAISCHFTRFASLPIDFPPCLPIFLPVTHFPQFGAH